MPTLPMPTLPMPTLPMPTLPMPARPRRQAFADPGIRRDPRSA
jgi:hypothetical protein